MAVLHVCVAMLVCWVYSTSAQLGPVYTLVNDIPIDNSVDRNMRDFSRNAEEYFDDVRYFEWESYDGWFNNPAHPEWGGAGKTSEVEINLLLLTWLCLISYLPIVSPLSRHAYGEKDTYFLPRRYL